MTLAWATDSDAGSKHPYCISGDMSSDEKQSSLPEDAANTIATESAKAAEHDTLKYHLLGPSLTKAGQDSVDQQKVP